MEAIVLKAVARELASELPARVQAVQQPSPRELVLLVRGAAERRLLISTDPEAPRLHLLEERPAFLPSPTAFCRLLRKRLEGRVLVRVECPGVERSVTFAFAAPRGARADLLLIAELMGKHSNLILLEVATGLVVDSLQHVAPPMSRVRTVLPGLPYTPPPASGRARPRRARRARILGALARDRRESRGALPPRARPRPRDAGSRPRPRAPGAGVCRRSRGRRARGACASARRGSTAAPPGRSSTPIAGCCSRCPCPGGKPSPRFRRPR